MSGAERYQALKGMRDIMPPDIYIWRNIEEHARRIFAAYGFSEIRTPIVEATGVFVRSIGESTDIVEKEMYTFSDKGDRSITLRPEGTACVVRSFVEHSLQTLPSPQKFYYTGPMFRYERPQSGRFRQFYQTGAECFGSPHPEADAEMIAMLRRFLSEVGLPSLKVQVNSIGCRTCRPVFRQALLTFFEDKRQGLCDDCSRRYETNPLRILDCKSPKCTALRTNAPRVTDHLCGECSSHFEALLGILDTLSIPYSVNPEMVRGLDYYTRTTFEVTSENLGAQNAVAAGGRYDRLVREFGGPDTPAVGFAVGMDRLVELVKAAGTTEHPVPSAFIAVMGAKASAEGMKLAESLRAKGLWIETGEKNSSLKSQLRRADRLSSSYVLIIGDDELASGKTKWKKLSDSTSGEAAFAEIESLIAGDPGR